MDIFGIYLKVSFFLCYRFFVVVIQRCWLVFVDFGSCQNALGTVQFFLVFLSVNIIRVVEVIDGLRDVQIRFFLLRFFYSFRCFFSIYLLRVRNSVRKDEQDIGFFFQFNREERYGKKLLQWQCNQKKNRDLEQVQCIIRVYS